MSKEAALAAATGGNPPPPPMAPAVETQVETPPQPQALKSDQFAREARQEAERVRKMEALNKERAEFDAEKKQAQEALKIARQFEETRKSDPVAALKLIGFTEAEIINWMAAQETEELTPDQVAKKTAQEIIDAKFKERDELEAKRQKEIAVQRDNQIISGFRSDISKVIESDKTKYEYCAWHGPAAEELIYETVFEIVKQSKGTEIITAEEAAQMVENYYEEQDKAMSKLKKRIPVQAAPPAPPKQPERTRTVTPPRSSRTLTNQATVTSASVAKASTRFESKSEKRERLIEALRSGAKP